METGHGRKSIPMPQDRIFGFLHRFIITQIPLVPSSFLFGMQISGRLQPTSVVAELVMLACPRAVADATLSNTQLIKRHASALLALIMAGCTHHV